MGMKMGGKLITLKELFEFFYLFAFILHPSSLPS